MKIIKILFLGIVLVMFNIAYLAAQTLPDSISVTMTSADPGSVMEITVDVRFHSDGVGGLAFFLQGLPTALVTTDVGVDITDGTATPPTEDGTWWYEWTEGYGAVLKTGSSLAAEVTFTPGDPTAEDSSSVFGFLFLGANIGQMQTLPPEFGGFDPAKIGPVLKFWVNVPEGLAEGTHDLVIAEGGGFFTFLGSTGIEGTATISVDQLVVANIPDNTWLDMVATQGAASGGSTELSVTLANKDTVAAGSFDLTFDDAIMTLDSVVAGSRATGASFSFSAPQAAEGTALAADVATTVSFSGVNIAPGSGDLCKLYFDVAPVGAGVLATVALSSVDLDDPSGADVIDQIAPVVPATALSFSFGDTLSLADMMGEGTATIIEGQLYVPVMLKNASAVSAVRFYISEPVGQEDILSLATEVTANVDRATGWMVSSIDTLGYIQVFANATTPGASIAAGNGKLFDIVYDINTAAFTVPAAGEATVDLVLGLAGVELTDADGDLLGVEGVGATASLDFRVPNEGEGTGPGATLPKAFSLKQNHPNPFNPSTTINYQIPDDVGSVRFSLNVYDIRGRMVRTLDEGMKGAGTYSVFWDGTDSRGRQVSSGVYFYRFVSSEYNATRKMIMLK